MIVKIQLPLGGDMTQALIYNQSKQLYYQHPVAELGDDMLKCLNECENKKAYFHAGFHNGTLCLGRRALNQWW